MADEALFIGWGEVVRGREPGAPDLFEDVVQYFGSLQQEGRIDGFEPWFLERHGGDLQGFFLVRGDAARLDEIRRDEGFERLLTRISLVVDDLGVTTAYTGGALQRLMGMFRESTAGLTG